MYRKDDRRLHNQLKKMYSSIWGQVSDELCATKKIISGFYSVADRFDATGILKLVQKAMLNVRSRKYFTAAVQMIKRIFYYMGQYKRSTV